MQKIDKILFRPHHLLCSQGYSGHGYNDIYVQNMNAVTEKLRTDPDAEVTLIFGNDILCQVCPHAVDQKCCETEEKVQRFDRKVVEYYGLEEKTYRYQDVIRQIHQTMTAQRMDDICGDCEWAKISACKKNIISGKYLL